MKFIYRLLFILLLTINYSVFADNSNNTDPLFINVTTNESHRALMAISFGKNQLERGHPLTIFLNDKGVFLASKKNSEEFTDQQKMLNDIIEKGATVLICKMCMKHYGVTEEDLLSGITISNPDITGNLLFKDDTQTLSW